MVGCMTIRARRRRELIRRDKYELFKSLCQSRARTVLLLVLTGAIAAGLLTSLITAVFAGGMHFCTGSHCVRARVNVLEQQRAGGADRVECPWYRAALQPALRKG